MWTPARTLEAIREWVEARGEPPRSSDWRAAGDHPPHPSYSTVALRYPGGWRAAITDAGYPPPPRRPRRHSRPRAKVAADLRAEARRLLALADDLAPEPRRRATSSSATLP